MMKTDFRSFLSEYGNVLVLLLLCLCISLVTIEEQSATSSSAARELALEVAAKNLPDPLHWFWSALARGRLALQIL